MSSKELPGAAGQGSEGGRSEAFAALAGGLVHDLNNLLSATVMLVDLLSASCKERDRALLGSVAESAQRGVALVRQLNWLARGSEEKGTLFQPRYLLLDVARMIQATSSPEISVVSDFPQDLWLLQGDPFRLYRALLELCQAARGQMPGGGKLTLAARNELLDEIAAALRPGLAAGPHLVLEATASSGGGKFSASAAAVFAAGGAVPEVAAIAGGGQVFRLYLPAAGLPAEEKKKPTRVPVPGGGELVLVVEGDAAVRQALAGVLEQHSYRTLAAADGAEAVALFARSSATIALAVVGSSLRFLDGPAVVRALRRLRDDVPVVAIGGADELAAWPQDPSLVAEAVLAKPFTVPDLLAAVHRVVSKAGVVPRTTRESSRR